MILLMLQMVSTLQHYCTPHNISKGIYAFCRKSTFLCFHEIVPIIIHIASYLRSALLCTLSYYVYHQNFIQQVQFFMLQCYALCQPCCQAPMQPSFSCSVWEWQKAGWEPRNDAVQLEHCRIQTVKVDSRMNYVHVIKFCQLHASHSPTISSNSLLL